MKKVLFILGGLLVTINLCSCDKQVETRLEYVDRVVEVEKPIEVIREVELIKEVPIETTVYIDREVIVEKEVEKTVTVEVPVEKVVEVEKIIEKEIPVEVEKIVTKTVTVEVPVEKVVEVEKIIEVEKVVEKEVVVERYNNYYEKLVEALSNATYCDDSNYHITTVGWTIPYLAVYCQGLSGSKNPVVGYHSLGATETFMHMFGVDQAGVNYTDTHNQICAIKRNDTEVYEDYLPKPIGSSGYYHGEYHYNDIYGPSEQYKHTLGNNLGLHVLTNVKVECISANTAINYQNIPAIRTVISYDEDYWIGEPTGIMEQIRVINREIFDTSLYEKSEYYSLKVKIGTINPTYEYHCYLKK